MSVIFWVPVCHRQPEMNHLLVQSSSKPPVYSSVLCISAYMQNAGDLEVMTFIDAPKLKLEGEVCALCVCFC